MSASGDSSNRLIASDAVAAVDPSLFPDFADVIAPLQPETGTNNSHYVVDGQVYGVPYMYGPNFLMYNTDVVKPAPTSWDVVFETELDGAANPYAGKITAYDFPIYIADAALYLKTHQPDLGITDPYELTSEQLDAAVELLKQQSGMIDKYWAAYTDRDRRVRRQLDGGGHRLAHQPEPVRAGRSGRRRRAHRGHDRLGRHVDDVHVGTTPQLHARVDEVDDDRRRAGRGGRLLRRRRPATSRRATSCASAWTRPTARDRPRWSTPSGTATAETPTFLDSLALWKTPQADCGDDRGTTCQDYSIWQQKWTEVRGA